MSQDSGTLPPAEELAAAVLDILVSTGRTIAVAESCTGGMLGAVLTSLPGSSRAVQGGVIAYSNDLKERLLDVPTAIIAEYGAVSDEVARAMAAGVAWRCGADVTVAITGIAGPGGGSDEKPVGTVWFGWSIGGAVVAERIRFSGDRSVVRSEAVRWALHRLDELLRAQRDRPAANTAG